MLLQGSYWCGSGGCTMLVFLGNKDGFKYVCGSTVSREPIRISDEKSSGWKTLIVNTKGKGDVLLRFNGRRYPLNPSTQPAATPDQIRLARTVIE